MAKITYNNKVSIRSNSQAAINQFSADDANEIKSSVNDLYDEVGAGTASDNLIVVSINTGGATNKIKNTLDAIVDSSANKPYLVQVRPGGGLLAYIEDDFTIPPYVSLMSDGNASVTEIEANTTTGTLITMSEGSSIEGFKLKDKTLGTAIDVSCAGSVTLSNLFIEDVTDGIVVNNSLARVRGKFICLNEDAQGVLNDGLRVEAGCVVAESVYAQNDVTVGGAVVLATGSSSDLTLTDILAFSVNVQQVLGFEDGSSVNMYDVSAVGVVDGIVQSGASTVMADNVKMREVQNNGYRCELGTGGLNQMTFSAVLFEASVGGLDVNVTTSFLRVVGGPAQIRIEQSYIDPGANVIVQLYNMYEGDEASKFISELHVGSPTNPKECALGEGDSHVQLLAYTTTDDIVFTDITDAVRSVSGSTFTFPSTAIGASIYLTSLYPDSSGNPLQFYGFKTLIDTAAVLGAGSFTIQYYNTNSGWLDAIYMETQANGDFLPYAKSIFEHTGSHHIRGPFYLSKETDVNVKWDLNDPPSTGTDRYWIRLRIAGAITTAPIFEQIKLHGNRLEVNSDGWMEYFGKARPIGRLPWNIAVMEKAATDPGDQDLYLGDNLDIGGKKNRLDDGDVDRIGFKTTLPFDCDTSGLVDFSWACITSDASAGNIDWVIRWASSQDGGNVYRAAPGGSPSDLQTYSTSIAAPTAADTLQWNRVYLDISHMISRRSGGFGDTIWLTIERDGSSDSHGGDVSLVAINANYVKWCEGGHI